MSSKNVFIILLFGFIASAFAFNYGLYRPIETEQEAIENQLRRTIKKFNTARHAKRDLEHTREMLFHEKEILADIQSKFIKKGDLSSITFQMRDKTREYKLLLIDFTPVFKYYLADTSNSPVKPLPFSITVSGKFLDIGKFIESWEKFDFYIIPDEIHLSKFSSKTNKLEATIVGRFYAWEKDRGKYEKT
jgi:Tfp pilus assembly protein PilO